MSQLGALFSRLNDAINQEDYDLVISVADQILQQSPADIDALQCKAVALIKNSDFTGASKLFDASSELSSVSAYDRIYCLYRLRKFDDALKVLSQVPSKSRDEGFRHLEAQILYQSGQYEAAVQIYEQHFVNSKNMDAELKTNICAAFISAGQPAKVASFLQSVGHRGTAADETYELAFNVASALADLGQLTAAQQKLNDAVSFGESLLKGDGLSSDEIADELALVRVQLAYVLQLQQQQQGSRAAQDEAMQIYNEVLAIKPSDQAVVATANNNVVSMRSGDARLFDSLKKQNHALHEADARLSVRQRTTMHYNHCLLLILMKSDDKLQSELATLKKSLPAHSEYPVLIEASLAYRDKDLATALRLLSDFVSRSQGPVSSAVSLALAHVHLASNNLAQAVAVLAPLACATDSSPLAFRPALVATVVALYTKAGDIDAAVQVLSAAAQHWQQAQHPQTARMLLQELAQFQMNNGRQAESLATFDRLHQKGASASSAGRDPAMLCRLVLAAGSNGDAVSAQKYAAQLPAFADEGKLKSLDVAALQAAAIKTTSHEDKKIKDDEKSAGSSAAPAAASGFVQKAEKKKAKKKRKPILPKGFDPTKPNNGLPPIDPERWLPRYERSYYRAKGKNKRANAVGKGSQGGIARTEKEKKEEEKLTSPTSPTAAAAAPAAASSSGSSKKKGKK